MTLHLSYVPLEQVRHNFEALTLTKALTGQNISGAKNAEHNIHPGTIVRTFWVTITVLA